MKKNILTFLILGILLLLAGCEEVEPQPTLNLPVKVDFSAYEQRDPNDPLYTRLSPEPLTGLIPSEDYGTLYPFIGARQSYLTENGYEGPKVDYYGFADASGRIIVDPVYTDIRLLSGGEGGTHLPFWILGKDNPDSGSRYSTCYAIASLDGSFVTDFRYSYVGGYPDCIVTLSLDWGEPVYELYDHAMELQFTTAELPYSSQIIEARYQNNGLFLLHLKGEEDRHSYYFMDLNGTLVAGPYAFACSFSCGWAAVEIRDDCWTYVDTAGTPMDRTFHDCEPYYQGGYTLVETETHGEILDIEGKTLLTVPKPDSFLTLTVTQNGLFIDSWKSSQYYSFDGALLYETQEKHWFPFEMVYLSKEDPSAPYLYHVELQKKVPLPPLTEHTEIETQYFIENRGPFLSLVYVDRRDRSMTFYLFTPELELLSVSNQTRPELFSEQAGKEALSYVAIPSDEGAELYDPEGMVLGLCPMSDFDTGRIYEGGILSLTNDFCTKRYNSQGELIFCYPFTSTMED